MKFSENIHAPLRRYRFYFLNLLTVHLAPQSGLNLTCPILWFIAEYLQNNDFPSISHVPCFSCQLAYVSMLTSVGQCTQKR